MKMNQITISKKEDGKVQIVFIDETCKVQRTIKNDHIFKNSTSNNEAMPLSKFIESFPELNHQFSNQNGGWNTYHKATLRYLSAVKASLRCEYPFYITDEKGEGLSINSISNNTIIRDYYGLPHNAPYCMISDDHRDLTLPVSLDDTMKYIAYYGFKGMVNDLDIVPISEEEVGKLLDDMAGHFNGQMQ